jgi:hypothetical protein
MCLLSLVAAVVATVLQLFLVVAVEAVAMCCKPFILLRVLFL